MAELYKLFADQSNGEIFTLMFFGLLFLAFVLHKKDMMEKQHIRPTGFDKAQLYSSGGIALFCGILLFGKMLFPDNTDSLLQTLGLSDFLKSATLNFQAVVLGILGLLM